MLLPSQFLPFPLLVLYKPKFSPNSVGTIGPTGPQMAGPLIPLFEFPGHRSKSQKLKSITKTSEDS